MSKHFIPAHAEVRIHPDYLVFYEGGVYCPVGHYTKLGSVYTFVSKEYSGEQRLNFNATRVWQSESGRVVSMGGDNTSYEWAMTVIPLLERLEFLEQRIKVLEDGHPKLVERGGHVDKETKEFFDLHLKRGKYSGDNNSHG